MDKALIIRIYYFAFFSAVAALIPFHNLYFKEIDLSGTQIGVLSAVPPVVMLLSTPAWGLISDARNSRRQVLILLFLRKPVRSHSDGTHPDVSM